MDAMVWIPDGTFLMGSEEFYPEEGPVHAVTIDGFWMDPYPVTVAEYRRFVEDTGYVTTAQRPLDAAAYPDADPDLLVPGSLVFQRTAGPVSLDDYRAWWAYVPGATWDHPEGPDSSVEGRDDHPVTQIAWEDAAAYAAWVGKDLPSEAEWERAARGGIEGQRFAWGDDFAPGGAMMANTWQGEFPWQNLLTDGYAGTSPVGSFPANPYGLYDMIGNVWEWTRDLYTSRHAPAIEHGCCAPQRPAAEGRAADEAGRPGPSIPLRVTKGGSHLCAPTYCLRYRPAARQGEAVDTSTSHIGFRCVSRTIAHLD